MLQIFHTLKPLQKNFCKLIWLVNKKNTFQKNKQKLRTLLKTNFYNPQLDTRIKCDASRKGAEAALEKLCRKDRQTVSFAFS